MKKKDGKFTKIQRDAFEELRRLLTENFKIEAIVLFGSFARRKADAESDVDLLVLTKKPMPRLMRHEITDLVFDVNLKYGTNFSTLVLDKHSWDKGVYSVLPIKEEILKEGVKL